MCLEIGCDCRLCAVVAGFISVSLCLSGSAALAQEPAGFPKEPQAPPGAPNVLLIMTDDVGFAASATFGGPVPTPVYSELAAHGIRYNEFHTRPCARRRGPHC